MKLTVSTFLILLALVLGGCRDWFPPVDPTDPKDPRDTVPHYDTTDRNLTDKKWCLVAIDEDGTFDPLQDMIDPSLERYIYFEQRGQFTGIGGYNNFNGNYKVSNGAMHVSNFVATKRFSDYTEMAFFEILQSADTYVTDGYNLQIMVSDGRALYLARCDDSVVIDDPTSVNLNEDFRLHVGLGAMVTGADLLVEFGSVSDDSRCPLGVHCAWEGDATLRMRLTSGGNTIVGELHTNQQVGPREISYNGYTVTLVDLQPMPLPNEPIDPDSYVAVLRVTKN